jgi:large subunit ribosomal protein L24
MAKTAAKKKEQNARRSLGIRTGDNVVVISGKNKGAEVRKVLSVLPRDGKVIVEGVNVMKDRQRPQNTGRASGINQQEVIEKPFPIDRSNVMLADPKTNKPTRVSIQERDGKRVRIAKKSGEAIG